ncbi:MAG: TonB-dependent receptor [Gammaproteobacteria bacterium]|nr:TonB-dependent receptor [Gammaproteobacteria bacterium]
MYRINTDPREQTPGPGCVRRGFRSLLLGAASALCLQAMGLSAQTPEADSIPRYDLDAVTVSVLRSPVQVGSSPYAVSVAGEVELRQGKTGMFLKDALENLPGVQVQNRFNYAVGERISIRGYGAQAQFGVRDIRVVVDGIPATLPDGQSTLDHVDIGSLGRVEALRGPGAALYGNAAGGVLLFETEIPSDAPVRQEFTTVGGTDGLLRMQSTTSGTVNGTGYLLSLNRLGYDGYRTTGDGNPYGTAERYHLNGRIEQDLAGGDFAITVTHMDLDAENPGALPLAAFEEDHHQVWRTYTFFQTRKEVQQSQIGVTWDGPVGGGVVAEASLYGVARDFLNPLPVDVVDVDRRAGGARLALASARDPGDQGLHLLGGIDFDLQNDDRREYRSDGGRPETLLQNQTEFVRSTGLFGQASLGLGDRVNLVGGLRYDNTRFEVDDLFPVSGENLDDSGSRKLDAWNPTVGIHLGAAPGMNFFANFATSFQTPTAQQLGNQENRSGGFNPDLDPQRGRTLEAGVRGSLANRVAYEVAVFNTKLEDEFISFRNADDLTYWRNAGQSTRNGAEIMLRASLHDLLSGQFSYTYTDAVFDDYTVRGNDLSGNDVPGLAPQQLRASLRLGPSGWFAELGTDYRSEVPVNDSNEAPYADSYTLFDVRVGAGAVPLGGLQLSPFAGIQNLTDETYVSAVTINAFGGRYYEPGPGRAIYVGGTLSLSR